jgi:hypothetical protein
LFSQLSLLLISPEYLVIVTHSSYLTRYQWSLFFFSSAPVSLFFLSCYLSQFPCSLFLVFCPSFSVFLSLVIVPFLFLSVSLSLFLVSCYLSHFTVSCLILSVSVALFLVSCFISRFPVSCLLVICPSFPVPFLLLGRVCLVLVFCYLSQFPCFLFLFLCLSFPVISSCYLSHFHFSLSVLTLSDSSIPGLLKSVQFPWSQSGVIWLSIFQGSV